MLLFITDGLSSVRLVVDEDGDVVASYDADEFGNSILVDENGASTDQRWVGGLGYKDEVAATGLYYLRQRYYAPDLGRFLSRDPLGYNAGLNLYRYASNSPTTRVDPDGSRDVIIVASWQANPCIDFDASASYIKQNIFKSADIYKPKTDAEFFSILNNWNDIDKLIILGHGSKFEFNLAGTVSEPITITNDEFKMHLKSRRVKNFYALWCGGGEGDLNPILSAKGSNVVSGYGYVTYPNKHASPFVRGNQWGGAYWRVTSANHPDAYLPPNRKAEPWLPAPPND